MSHLAESGALVKKGRPVLDHILRPRFTAEYLSMRVGNTYPNVSTLTLALRLGADPNEEYKGSSVWALYIRFVNDNVVREQLPGSETQHTAFYDALQAMLEGGAASALPALWLLRYDERGVWWSEDDEDKRLGLSIHEYLQLRWPGIHASYNEEVSDNTMIAVSDLLEQFRDWMGDDVDALKRLLSDRTGPDGSIKTGP